MEGAQSKKERWEIVKLEPTDQQILCRGKGERAGGIPQTIVNAGLDFKRRVKAGDRFRHHSHRGDNWTVGGDENRKKERKERRATDQTQENPSHERQRKVEGPSKREASKPGYRAAEDGLSEVLQKGIGWIEMLTTYLTISKSVIHFRSWKKV